LNNLLDNAAKYSPPDTPIKVRLSRHDGEVSFSVSNSGPEIDRDELPKLFEPFFRTEAARLRGSQGVGLGLSVAARIAAVFGGRIIGDSSPGQGATFSVDLPESRALEKQQS
jgi:signal transduction histidine kinase